MTSLSESVTGDHAEVLVTTRRQRKRLLEALPKQIKDILDFNISRFDGKDAAGAEKWIRNVKEWANMNDIELMDAFDILLTEDALTLWKSSADSVKNNEEAISWFNDQFVIKKSIVDELMELANVSQGENERFNTFEIRVKKLVDQIYDTNLGKDEIVKCFLKSRVKDDRLKETFYLNKSISTEEMKEKAKIYEQMNESNTAKVHVLEKPTYAQRLMSNNHFYNPKTSPSNRFYQEYTTRNINPEPIMNQSMKPGIGKDRDDATRPRVPKYSLKQIAKRAFCRAKGRPDPEVRPLQVGQCFCCGEHGHRISTCPLKNRCLICGSNEHLFRNCRQLAPQKKTIYCINDEEEEEDRKYKHRTEGNIDDTTKDLAPIHDLNMLDLTGDISSVGSNQ